MSRKSYTSLSDFVLTTFSNWYQNRLYIQYKWEKNYRLYNGYDIQSWKIGEGSTIGKYREELRGTSGQSKEDQDEERLWRSSTFIKALKQKIMSGFSQASDVVLQNGRVPYSLKLKEEIEYSQPPELEPQQQPQMGQQIPGMPPQQMAVPQPQPDIDLEGQMEKKRIQMEKRISDQLNESKANIEMSKALLSDFLYGESYLKKIVKEIPFSSFSMNESPEDEIRDVDDLSIKKRKPANKNEEIEEYGKEFTIIRGKKSVPGIMMVTVWDIFRDLEADDLEDGKGIIHRQLIEPYDLYKNLDNPAFIKENIIEALNKIRTNIGGEYHSIKQSFPYINDIYSFQPKFRDLSSRENTAVYVEYWGRVPKELALQFEAEIDKKTKKKFDVMLRNSKKSEDLYMEGNDVEVMIGMVEEVIVTYQRTREEDRPFMRTVCEWNPDEPYGVGVADNVEQDQIMLNGAVRAFEDNKKLSGNVIVAIKRHLFEKLGPLKPGAMWFMKDELTNIQEAFQSVNIPDVGNSLLAVIDVAKQFIEEDSLIPRISQGISGGVAPGTAFEAALQADKAGKYMSGIIKNFDEGIIQPTIEWYYKYNMLDPTVDVKDEFLVIPEGFKVYKERIQALSKFNSYIGFVMQNPITAAHLDLRRVIEEYGRILDIDYEYLLKNPEKLQQEQMAAAQQAQQAQAIQGQTLQVGLAKAQADIQNKTADTFKKQTDAQKNINDMKIDRAEAINEIEKARNQTAITAEKLIADEQKRTTPNQPRQPTVPTMEELLQNVQ